ncbi:MAG: hypothetical protein QXV69_08265 [Sulfolobaceae archaeon]
MLILYNYILTFYYKSKDIKVFIIVFITYFIVHEAIFGLYTSFATGFNLPAFSLILVSFSYSQPFTAINYPFVVTSSPSIIVFVHGVEFSFTPLSIIYGVILASFIGYSVSGLVYLRKFRSLTYFIPITSLSIVSASSCCLTLPSLVAIMLFSSNLELFGILANFLGSWIGFVISYYLLPLISIFALYLISRSIRRVSEKCKLD